MLTILLLTLVIGTFNVIMQYTVEAFRAPAAEKLGILQGVAAIVMLWIVGAVLFKSLETRALKYYLWRN